MRQLVEKHTSDAEVRRLPRSASTRSGFALEAFDAIGRRREKDLGDRPIDTHVKAMDGTEFDGLDGPAGLSADQAARRVPAPVLPQAAGLCPGPRRSSFPTSRC